ncbi:PhnD/SsuA/transferrin family substrate-binding protein [Rhodobacteraceae bacterium D3-12]|nr:PhnD/SsuA/transferrin family substrate-binding protein [Rhodobacteraceae bacterium D3-12]
MSRDLIATLAMYDRAETAPANDAFWSAIRAALGDGPAALTRGDDLWALWQSPDLLLGQTCGLPFRARLHGHVTLVGTPDYGLPGCAPGYYNSVFVARDDTPLTARKGQRFAYNEPLSQSGWAAPALHMQALGITPGAFSQTGAHRASARAVAEGHADFAALDALSWAMIRAHDPFAADLHVIDATAPTPGLPFITALGRDPAPLRAAITTAINTLPDAHRSALHLRGLTTISEQDYLAMPTPPPPASPSNR